MIATLQHTAKMRASHRTWRQLTKHENPFRYGTKETVETLPVWRNRNKVGHLPHMGQIPIRYVMYRYFLIEILKSQLYYKR